MDQLDVLKLILIMESEEILDVALSSKEPEQEVLETSEEDNDELANRLAKAEELANNYKIRAEKAEKLAKSVKIEQPIKQESKVSNDLSTKDIYALMEAKVPEQDIEKVQEIAKLKGISVSEAIKLSLTKQILADEAEQRNTAIASNVGGSKRSSNRVSDEVLLAKAQKGEFPTSDEDLMRLARVRKGYKQ